MRQMDIKKRIISIACGNNFYVAVTNNGEVYECIPKDLKNCDMQKNFIEEPRKIIELLGKTIGNLFFFKAYYKKK